MAAGEREITFAKIGAVFFAGEINADAIMKPMVMAAVAVKNELGAVRNLDVEAFR